RAERVYKNALTWVKEHVKNPSQAESINTTLAIRLGAIYLKRKKFSDAEAQFKLSLTAVEKIYGKTSFGLIDNLLGLAEASEGQALIYPDKSVEAETYYKRALDILKRYDPSLENEVLQRRIVSFQNIERPLVVRFR